MHRQNGKSVPCSSTRPSLCCAQIVNTQAYMSQQTNRTRNMFHKLTWKNSYVIYLMEWILYKIEHVGKFETLFNLKLNNHKKDVSNLKVIPASYHFKTHVHNFMKHVKFTQIEKLSESSSVSKDTLKPRLKLWDFWINKLKTLGTKGLNQELNMIKSNNCIFSQEESGTMTCLQTSGNK